MSNKKKNAWKPDLSKNVLAMKFMQKSKEKIENELERKRVFEDPMDQPKDNGGIVYLLESSYVPCEDLVFGRFSFKGQNPEIEKIMSAAEAVTAEKAVEEAEAKGTVSAEEMVDRYSTLYSTIGKKFGKRKHEDVEAKSRKNKR
ncbi:M-phase phosphoprotein 6 [Chamberlinius hualienensis]